MEIKILNDFYDLVKWFLPKITKFPRNYRYTLGMRIENKLYGIVELLISARYSKKKIQLLKKTNIEIEMLRYYVRLCKDMKLITSRNYEFLSRNVNEIGKQLGGWIKEENA